MDAVTCAARQAFGEAIQDCRVGRFGNAWQQGHCVSRHAKKICPYAVTALLRLAVEGVKRARGLTSNVEFSPEDASRTDYPYLLEVLQAVHEAGASVLNVGSLVFMLSVFAAGYAVAWMFRKEWL